MPYKDVAPPAGEKITRTDRLNVPDQPIIPFIRGDGTGPDIWAASVRVFDAAVEKAYGESQYGDLPGKHGRHLRRYRVRRRYARSTKDSQFSAKRISKAVRQNPLWHKREGWGVLENGWRARKR